MLPFFPSLVPHTANNIWFDIDPPCNEETEVQNLERENNSWLNSITTLGHDLNPLGKVLVGPETDDEDANDDTDESDSHDEEDEEIIDTGHSNRPQVDNTYSPPVVQNNVNTTDSTNNETVIIQHTI